MMLMLELRDAWQRPVTAEVVIHRDTVEIRCQETVMGVADRDVLRRWVAAPFGVYAYDEISWLAVDLGIALCLGTVVSAHVLAPHVLADLRSRL